MVSRTGGLLRCLSWAWWEQDLGNFQGPETRVAGSNSSSCLTWWNNWSQRLSATAGSPDRCLFSILRQYELKFKILDDGANSGAWLCARQLRPRVHPGFCFWRLSAEPRLAIASVSVFVREFSAAACLCLSSLSPPEPKIKVENFKQRWSHCRCRYSL